MQLAGLIFPVFVTGGKGVREAIPHMPGIYRLSADTLVEETAAAYKQGITHFLIFGVPDGKDAGGTAAVCEDNLVARGIRALREAVPEATLFSDVCLCAYTPHGHCGIVDEDSGEIKSRETLDALARMACTHAAAGVHYVCPSAMAQGQVRRIRSALDGAGHESTRIMGYSAKFVSCAYGPFRGIADSAPRFGDRRAYQLDPLDPDAAVAKIREDTEAGADIVMIKPALWFLDVVRRVKEHTGRPLAVYNVSGEYAAVKCGAREGIWDERAVVSEIMSSFTRAGADYIITYHAKDIAQWMR